MCGGYYEEELEVQGPKWKFEKPETMYEAVRICNKYLPRDGWRVIDDDTIVFASIQLEEKFSIARSIHFND